MFIVKRELVALRRHDAELGEKLKESTRRVSYLDAKLQGVSPTWRYILIARRGTSFFQFNWQHIKYFSHVINTTPCRSVRRTKHSGSRSPHWDTTPYKWVPCSFAKLLSCKLRYNHWITKLLFSLSRTQSFHTACTVTLPNCPGSTLLLLKRLARLNTKYGCFVSILGERNETRGVKVLQCEEKKTITSYNLLSFSCFLFLVSSTPHLGQCYVMWTKFRQRRVLVGPQSLDLLGFHLLSCKNKGFHTRSYRKSKIRSVLEYSVHCVLPAVVQGQHLGAKTGIRPLERSSLTEAPKLGPQTRLCNSTTLLPNLYGLRL